MTEEQWLACDRPAAIFDFLRAFGGGTDRKLLLFSVACCRLKLRDAPMTLQDRHRRAIETIEGHADGLATAKQMHQACSEISRRAGRREELVPVVGRFSSGVGARLAARALGGGDFSPPACDLLRDLFGNRFRPVLLDDASRNPTVVAVAQSIYEERAFQDMPILGDALEDAGCANEMILAHCRGPGPHIRGCWVVDAVLHKV